jgi:hypothetical protein
MLTRPIRVAISLACLASSLAMAGCNPSPPPPPATSEPVPAASHHPSDPASKDLQKTNPPKSR